MNRRYAETAAGAGAVVAVVSGFLLFREGIFWTGSVSQAHAACSAVGPWVAITGADIVNACANASTAYGVLSLLFSVSVLATIVGLVMLWATRSEAR
jgi:hypothetical protein